MRFETRYHPESLRNKNINALIKKKAFHQLCFIIDLTEHVMHSSCLWNSHMWVFANRAKLFASIFSKHLTICCATPHRLCACYRSRSQRKLNIIRQYVNKQLTDNTHDDDALPVSMTATIKVNFYFYYYYYYYYYNNNNSFKKVNDLYGQTNK